MEIPIKISKWRWVGTIGGVALIEVSLFSIIGYYNILFGTGLLLLLYSIFDVI